MGFLGMIAKKKIIPSNNKKNILQHISYKKYQFFLYMSIFLYKKIEIKKCPLGKTNIFKDLQLSIAIG